MSITICYSTRKFDESFHKHLEDTCGVKNVEILYEVNNGNKSLAKLYNEFLLKSQNDIVVFCHDDIYIHNDKWGKKLLKSFSDTDFGIIGIAGTTDLEDGCWWKVNHRMVGQVRHKHEGKTNLSIYSNRFEEVIETVVVDGLFMAVKKSKLKKNFNESFNGFHFYDLPLCVENHLQGVKIGVTFDLDITHYSIGMVNEQWSKNKEQFEETYKDIFPLRVQPKSINFPTKKIKPIKNNNNFISIIIPHKNNYEVLENCVNSIIQNTHQAKYEIIIADTGSIKEEKEKIKENILSDKVRMVEYDYYNFAKINNDVVKNHLSPQTNLIIFSNNDIKLLNDAVDRMVKHYKENYNIGTIGIRLHYGDNSVQHSGILMAIDRAKRIYVTHKHLHSYYTYTQTQKTEIGCTGAFLMIERKLFESIMFNETYKECFEDVELNLRCIMKGRKNWFIGDAVAYHYESLTRNQDEDKLARTNEDYVRRLFPFIKDNFEYFKPYLMALNF